MKDAANLVDAIEKALITREQTLKDAIDAYESEMKPRGVREVNLSLEQARKASDSKAIKDSPICKIGWNPGEVDIESKQGEILTCE
jgi:2-polyprenyl-6-methoxyphenol hydroxylase-like FAD-dependent oxidoreductase